MQHLMDIPNSNGHSESRIAQTLEEEVSLGYKPVLPLEALWLTGSEMPTITLRRDIEFMLYHPIVSSSLEYYKSGLSGAEFWGGIDPADPKNPLGKPISIDPRVSQFVMAHVDRFWNVGVPLLQDAAYPWGWAPGEHIYREVDGFMTWSHMKGFHPNDSFILTLDHSPVGIRIKNIRDVDSKSRRMAGHEDPSNYDAGMRRYAGSIDLWFASGAVPAKAAWYPHRPRFNQFYGRSQLLGAWRPWRRLGWRDAVEQVIDAAIYRAGYRGPIVRHPLQDMQTATQGIPATQKDGQGNPRRNARDVARQMVEWAKAGAGFTLSSEQYPPVQGGGPKWDVEWPEHVMDVRPLIEGARYLEDHIMLGIGVPPELLRSGGTGSGYSGRSIPREAFLEQQQRVADAMLRCFVEQVLRPLVLWNFGDGQAQRFEVQCKSLLQSQASDKLGQEQQQDASSNNPNNPNKDLARSDAAKDAWQLRRGNKGLSPAGDNQVNTATAGNPALSTTITNVTPTIIPDLNQQQVNKIIDITRRAIQRRAA
jgi:hypothetical protein